MQEESAMSSETLTGSDLGEHGGMPETIESLEVESDIAIDLPVTRSASDTIIVGDPTLPLLSIVTDPDCSYCKAFVREHLAWIEKEYVARKNFAIEWIFLPMNSNGTFQAKILLCAEEHDAFAKANREILFSPPVSTNQIAAFAKRIGVTGPSLLACVNGKTSQSTLTLHTMKADELDIERVPGFSLNGHSWLGVATREGLREEIDRAMENR